MKIAYCWFVYFTKKEDVKSTPVMVHFTHPFDEFISIIRKLRKNVTS